MFFFLLFPPSAIGGCHLFARLPTGLGASKKIRRASVSSAVLFRLGYPSPSGRVAAEELPAFGRRSLGFLLTKKVENSTSRIVGKQTKSASTNNLGRKSAPSPQNVHSAGMATAKLYVCSGGISVEQALCHTLVGTMCPGGRKQLCPTAAA
jgi:hypothetical protein